MNRLEEIAARLAAINTEVETASGDALTALESEVTALEAERSTLIAEVESRQQLRSRIASGTQPGVAVSTPAAAEPSEAERAAQKFAETRKLSIAAEQARSILVSGGDLATPTAVSGINDTAGAKVSSIIDLCRIENCEGMSTHRVAYIASDIEAAAAQTEGSAATGKEPTFDYVDITPTDVAVVSQISKQAKKQTPLNYHAKVQEQALLSLRKKAAAIATSAMVASELNDTVDAKVSSSKGVVDATTLRNLALAFGGDESIGTGVLFLNKTDLIALGDVRGTNEKKAVYEIIPDTTNPNTGIIKDGGLSVKYCLNSNLTACSGTAQAESTGDDIVTMVYGDPMALELDLFSPYEIKVSEDFAFTSLMDTIRGDVEIGADVVVAGGFVALVIPKAAAVGG